MDCCMMDPGRLVALGLVASVLLLQGVYSLQWDVGLEDGAQMMHCEGDNVVFPWRYTLDEGEAAIGVSWNRLLPKTDKEQSLASLFIPTNNFSPVMDRVSHSQVDLAAMRLSQVTTNDSANYTVIVRLNEAEAPSMQTVSLFVAAKPETEEDTLNVMEVSNGEVLDGQDARSVPRGLMCGHFQSLGTPPVAVSWKDPAGNVLASSRFEEGYFFLDLEAGYKGGKYICFLDESMPAVDCLPKDSELREPAELEVLGLRPSASVAGVEGGVVAGVVIAIIIIVAVAIIIAIFLVRSKRGKSYAPKEPESPGPEDEAEEPLKI